jgi:acyl dehydratase
MVVGMSVSDISQKAIGKLGSNDIKLTAPVFVGDTTYAESEVLAKREFGFAAGTRPCHRANDRLCRKTFAETMTWSVTATMTWSPTCSEIAD